MRSTRTILVPTGYPIFSACIKTSTYNKISYAALKKFCSNNWSCAFVNNLLIEFWYFKESSWLKKFAGEHSFGSFSKRISLKNYRNHFSLLPLWKIIQTALFLPSDNIRLKSEYTGYLIKCTLLTFLGKVDAVPPRVQCATLGAITKDVRLTLKEGGGSAESGRLIVIRM